MNNCIIKTGLIFIYLFLILSLKSQEYTLSKLSSDCTYPELKHENPLTCTIFLLENGRDTLRRFQVQAPADSDFDQRITVRNISNIKNYNQVINIELSYTGCCSSIYDHFLLVGSKGEIQELPNLYNVHCDGLEPKLDYIFPNERFGEDEVILKAIKSFNNSYDLDTIQITNTLLLTNHGLVEKTTMK